MESNYPRVLSIVLPILKGVEIITRKSDSFFHSGIIIYIHIHIRETYQAGQDPPSGFFLFWCNVTRAIQPVMTIYVYG